MDQQMNFDAILTRVVKGELPYQPLGGPEIVAACDQQTGQYLLIAAGWRNGRHLNHLLFHARLQDGFVVIETDNTEEGLTSALIEAGIPATSIVSSSQYRKMNRQPAFAEAIAA